MTRTSTSRDRHGAGRFRGLAALSRFLTVAAGCAALASGQILPAGWTLKPAGFQIQTGDFPSASIATRDGKLLVLNTGQTASISIADGAKETRVPIADGWQGMAFSADQKLLYVGGGARNVVGEYSWSGTELKLVREVGAAVTGALAPADFLGDVALSPDGRLLYAAEVFRDSVVVINLQTGRLIERFKTGRRPYRVLLAPDGKSFFTTSWTEGTLYQHETSNGAEIGRLRLGPQTTDMILSTRKVPEDTSNSRFRVFVAASGTNNVFAVSVNDQREMKQLELVNVGTAAAQPAGMTPSALALSADETRLYVACSDANAVAVLDVAELRSRLAGFLPTGAYPSSVKVLADGRIAVANAAGNSLSLIPPPDEAALATHTQTVLASTAYRAEMADEVAAAKSLFERVVYIVTDRPVTGPNQAKLARDFVNFTNFKGSGTSTVDGHLWATGAIAPAFTRRLLPARSANRLRFANFAGGEPANIPPGGYLWSNARLAGISVRNFGEFVENDRATEPSLVPLTNLAFKGPDADRARVFLEEWAQGKPAQLTLVRLAGDDAALGRIVEGISKSPAWSKTAIFVTSVTGSTLLIASPYAKRGAKDDTLYGSASVLRTIELILGLRPMTQFDAAAIALSGAFSPTADSTPFSGIAP